MRTSFSCPLIVGALLAPLVTGTGALAQPAPTEPTLKRVLLSTGGVALFEYDAAVAGNGSVALTVRLDQVDDVLRSLSVTDPAGAPSFASLAVRSPLAERFRDLPFDPSQLSDPASLLEALKGAQVSITGPSSIKGRIISVNAEEVALDNGEGTVTRHRISVLTDKGLRQAVVEDIDTVNFEDADVKAALDTALSALSQAREKDTRTIAIDLAQGNARTVKLTHIAEVPLWKSSYRLTLPEGAEKENSADLKGRMSGWATLENLSGQDWTNVRLTVLSGNPVTFRQNIYSPYRVERPIVPVEVYGRVLPPADDGSFAPDEEMAGGMAMKVMDAPRMLARQSSSRADVMYESSMAVPSPVSPTSGGYGASANVATEVSAVTAQVLFTFPTPITLPTGQSLLAPLMDLQIPIERVTHVIPTDRTTRPMAAVRVTNDTDSALPPGPISLTQVTGDSLAYLGDARLNMVPVGENRLLDFAVDNDISVQKAELNDRRVGGLTAADGVITLRTIVSAGTVYMLKNSADGARTVIIDHPKQAGWTLKAPEGAVKVEETPTMHRVTYLIKGNDELKTTLTLELTENEWLEAGRLDVRELARLSADGALSPKEREAIDQLSALAKKTADADVEVGRVDMELRSNAEAQSQARDNIQAVPKGSDDQKRFMARLSALDTQATALEKQRAEARKTAQDARDELAKVISGLKLP